MPLSEKARIEIYLPDVFRPSYAHLLNALECELTYTSGGCTILRGVSGSYPSGQGQVIPDRVNLIYTDIPFSLGEDLSLLSRYTDDLRDAAFSAPDEEVVLVVAYTVYHAE